MPQKSKTAGDANPLAASTRIGSANAKTLAGQIRHDLRRGPQPGYVDAGRAHLNRVLIEPLPPGHMRTICRDRRALRDTQRGMKSNSAIATRGLIFFGSRASELFEKLGPDQQDAAFLEVAQAVADRLETSLHGLVVHLDEASIHAHYELAAYNKHGHSISKSTRPKVMAELQDITAEIMARHCPGIERGTRYGDRLAAGADFADVVHKSVRELHRTLPADLEKRRAALSELAQAESQAVARVDEMKSRVDKLAEKAELSVREVKRLETYQGRLIDRLKELETAQAASEAARVEASRLLGLARLDREEEEARAAKIRVKVDAVGAAVTALSREVAAGTIRRTEGGKLTAKAPDVIRAGYPELAPAAVAAADLVMHMDGAKASLAADRLELAKGQRDLLQRQISLKAAVEEIEGMREKLRRALVRVVLWLRRPELADSLRDEARVLVSDAQPLLSPTEDTSEEARPGF